MSEPGKHTAGEWKYELARIAKDAPVFGFNIHVDGKKPSIARAGTYETYKLTIAPEWEGEEFAKEYFTVEEVEANAKLLASSPELLAACIWAKDVLKKLSEAGRYPEFLLSENGGEGFSVLTNAINKATK